MDRRVPGHRRGRPGVDAAPLAPRPAAVGRPGIWRAHRDRAAWLYAVAGWPRQSTHQVGGVAGYQSGCDIVQVYASVYLIPLRLAERRTLLAGAGDVVNRPMSLTEMSNSRRRNVVR